MFDLDEFNIQLLLMRDLMSRGHQMAVPNVNWSYLYWEADVVSVTQANYLYEFEIKVSKSDFVKDFSKKKHYHFRHPNNYMKMPNYFSYVAPIEAIPLCVPDYAGLIEVYQIQAKTPWYSLRDIKKPKQLHGGKIEQRHVFKILRTLVFKYMDRCQTIEASKIQKKLFN